MNPRPTPSRWSSLPLPPPHPYHPAPKPPLHLTPPLPPPPPPPLQGRRHALLWPGEGALRPLDPRGPRPRAGTPYAPSPRGPGRASRQPCPVKACAPRLSGPCALCPPSGCGGPCVPPSSDGRPEEQRAPPSWVGLRQTHPQHSHRPRQSYRGTPSTCIRGLGPETLTGGLTREGSPTGGASPCHVAPGGDVRRMPRTEGLARLPALKLGACEVCAPPSEEGRPGCGWGQVCGDWPANQGLLPGFPRRWLRSSTVPASWGTRSSDQGGFQQRRMAEEVDFSRREAPRDSLRLGREKSEKPGASPTDGGQTIGSSV